MRTCGDCTLCCKLVPVRDKSVGMDKGANERCKHQSYTHGCKVYNQPNMPRCCQLWNCRWLIDPKTIKLARPDRAGYVLDIMPDYITLQPDEPGEPQIVQIVQVWIDPKRPNAHRDPALRDYLGVLADQGIVALIRYNAEDAFVLAAPQFTGGRGWQELSTNVKRVTHSILDIVQQLGPMNIELEFDK